MPAATGAVWGGAAWVHPGIAKARVRELVAKHYYSLPEGLSRDLDRIYERAARDLS